MARPFLGKTGSLPVGAFCLLSCCARKARDGLGLVYPAFESRAEIVRLIAEREKEAPWPRDPDGAPLYPGSAGALPPEERARLLQSGAPYALRLDVAAAFARGLAR